MIKKISILLLLVLVYKAGDIYYEISRTQVSGTAAAGALWHLQDRCKASANLQTGPSNGPWYNTVSPNEAFVSERTHTFPHTCNLYQLLGQGTDQLEANVLSRTLEGLPAIYNLATRDRDEIFVLGGVTKSTESCEQNSFDCATGVYIAKVNAHSLEIEWRKPLHDAKQDGEWDYPGAIGVHGNGYVYVVNGYRVFKIDPENGDVINSQNLPTAPNQAKGDTVYNGFSILSDGNLIAKSLTRIKGSQLDSIVALLFSYDAKVPSTLAIIEPENLSVVDSIKVLEPVVGRISNTLFNGQEYIYMAGYDNLFRFKYFNNHIEQDKDWGPVRYRFGQQKPATALGIMNDFVIVQNNIQLAQDPLSVTAISQLDASISHRITPFENASVLPGSLQFSLPTIDAENNRVYSYDFLENSLVALDFDPQNGFTIAWSAEQRSLSFGPYWAPKTSVFLYWRTVTQAFPLMPM